MQSELILHFPAFYVDLYEAAEASGKNTPTRVSYEGQLLYRRWASEGRKCLGKYEPKRVHCLNANWRHLQAPAKREMTDPQIGKMGKGTNLDLMRNCDPRIYLWGDPSAFASVSTLLILTAAKLDLGFINCILLFSLWGDSVICQDSTDVVSGRVRNSINNRRVFQNQLGPVAPEPQNATDGGAVAFRPQTKRINQLLLT